MNAFFLDNFDASKIECKAPSTLAAHLEAGNTILQVLLSKVVSFERNLTQILNFRSRNTSSSVRELASRGLSADPYEEMLRLCKICSGSKYADFHGAISRAAHISVLRRDFAAFEKILDFTLQSSESGSLLLLSIAGTNFPVETHDLIPIFRSHALVFKYDDDWVYPSARLPAVRAAALGTISRILDSVEDMNPIHKEVCQISKVVYRGMMDPVLAHQICRFSGHVIHSIMLFGAFGQDLTVIRITVQKALFNQGLYLSKCITDDSVSNRHCHAIYQLMIKTRLLICELPPLVHF